MNSCIRIVRRGDWTFGIFKLHTYCQSCHRRGLATAAGVKHRGTAADLAEKLRQDKRKPEVAEKPMSKQQKRLVELKRFSQQLQRVHPNVLAKHLHRRLLYRDKDVVIINKPYGVPVRENSEGTSIESVLPVLSKMMEGMKINTDSQLLPCMKLDKNATGALLLARSEEIVEHIVHLRNNNQIQSTYWAVTVGVPVPSEGIIDIPIMEKAIAGPQPHYKMVLSPVFKMNEAGDGVMRVRGHRQAQPAVTKYRVLDSCSGCSLVELRPLTGVTHQMRVHMALALSCPILGDHKYSHQDKLAPQKLPEGVLGKLKLEPSKSRHLPLHLHARQIRLTSREEVDVTCPPPKYFTQSLKYLYLETPDKKDDE